MATTREDIRRMLDRAEPKHTHMLVVCDTFDWEDYPVYVAEDEKVEDVVAKYHLKNMQRVMEVYNLRQPLEPQVESVGAWNL